MVGSPLCNAGDMGSNLGPGNYDPTCLGAARPEARILVLQLLKRSHQKKKKRDNATARESISESHLVTSDSLRPHGMCSSVQFSRPEYWSG